MDRTDGAITLHQAMVQMAALVNEEGMAHERECWDVIERTLTQPQPALTHGRHCPCGACRREDWTNSGLASCGMHGLSCPPVYAPLTQPQPDTGLTALEMAEFDERAADWQPVFRERILAALRPTPAAPLHPHDGYSYDGCKCVCCLNIRALATPAAQKPDAGLREALADQIATLYGWTAHEQASPRQRALYVLWREWHALVGERTEHPALSDERIESLSRQRAEECAALRSTPAAPNPDPVADVLLVREQDQPDATRSTPAARKPDARSLADRITGVIAIPPDGEVEP